MPTTDPPQISTAPLDRLAAYWRNGRPNIHGWVAPVLLKPLSAAAAHQADVGVRGDVLEIGVHKGALFLALDALRGAGEKAVAVDVFDDQHLNVDNSGRGSREKFDEHVRLWSHDPDGVVAVQADSLTLAPADIVQSEGFRLISIDGSHTVEHTLNDLALAEATAVSGAVVLVDDYFNPRWPGVHEAFARFNLLGAPKLVPFLHAGKKLFLTTLDAHAGALENARARLEPGAAKPRLVRLYGHRMLVV